MSLWNIGIVGEDDNWDLGIGVGFYVNVIKELWKKYY